MKELMCPICHVNWIEMEYQNESSSRCPDVTMSDICTMSGETLSRFEDLSCFNLHKPLTTKVYSAAVSWKVVPASVSHFTATVILSMVGIRGIQRHSAPSCSKSLGSLFQTLIHFELYNTIYTSCIWHVESIGMVWSFGNNPPKTLGTQVSRVSRPKRAPGRGKRGKSWQVGKFGSSGGRSVSHAVWRTGVSVLNVEVFYSAESMSMFCTSCTSAVAVSWRLMWVVPSCLMGV